MFLDWLIFWSMKYFFEIENWQKYFGCIIIRKEGSNASTTSMYPTLLLNTLYESPVYFWCESFSYTAHTGLCFYDLFHNLWSFLTNCESMECNFVCVQQGMYNLSLAINVHGGGGLITHCMVHFWPSLKN
jgi:hypothetical protein